MKEDDYLKQTELRKAQNYNARMNWWNETKGPGGPIHEAKGCIIGVVIFIVVCTIIGGIIMLFGG